MAGPGETEGARLGLGALIRHQRQLAQLSLRELATATSVSNAYLSQVERGLHQPSIRILRAIAGALEISSDQLLAHAGLGVPARAAAGDTGRPTAAERAIAEDPRLDEEARQTLLLLYRRLAQLPDDSAAARTRRSRSRA